MIIYEAEGVKFPNIMKRETTAWIRKVAASYGKKVGEIGYLFVNDDKILEVNNQFLGHDYYTDIITFDYTEGKTISGDISTKIKNDPRQAYKAVKSAVYRRILGGNVSLLAVGGSFQPEIEPGQHLAHQQQVQGDVIYSQHQEFRIIVVLCVKRYHILYQLVFLLLTGGCKGTASTKRAPGPGCLVSR